MAASDGCSKGKLSGTIIRSADLTPVQLHPSLSIAGIDTGRGFVQIRTKLLVHHHMVFFHTNYSPPISDPCCYPFVCNTGEVLDSARFLRVPSYASSKSIFPDGPVTLGNCGVDGPDVGGIMMYLSLSTSVKLFCPCHEAHLQAITSLSCSGCLQCSSIFPS